MMKSDFFGSSEVVAWWMFTHPNKKVVYPVSDSTFWYDDEKCKFFGYNPNIQSSDDFSESLTFQSALARYLKRYESADCFS